MKKLILTVVLGILLTQVGFAQNVSDPKSLQITVYNANFGLVKDTRQIDLEKGIVSLNIEDVASTIDATSVLFKPLTNPDAVSILEQNYQYDLINPDNILSKLVGERVWFDDNKSGILLNPPANGGLVVRMDDGKLVMNPKINSVAKMPDGLHPIPTLNWLLQSNKSGKEQVEISYLANGISWNADYVVLVNKDDTKLDMSGWVTLSNQTGTSFKDAKLTLMAGDVRRIQPVGRGGYAGEMAMDAMAFGAAPQFTEKSFFEYHIYQMERKTTIANKETKQLSLLNATGVPVTKELIYDARKEWFRGWWYPGANYYPTDGYDTSNFHKVNVVLVATNSKANNMGMPLPKGKIRVYKLDDDGSQQFIGEDEIDHTPKDEKIRLYVGDAFDVVGDYKRTNFRKISDTVVEESFEVKIRNHKTTSVNVRVVEHVFSDWSVTAASHKWQKNDATTLEFPITVQPDKEVIVTYTVLTKW